MGWTGQQAIATIIAMPDMRERFVLAGQLDEHGTGASVAVR